MKVDTSVAVASVVRRRRMELTDTSVAVASVVRRRRMELIPV